MGDTLNINNKAQQQNTYDAIVVGSGISGGWAAKELTENGLKVFITRTRRNFEHIKIINLLLRISGISAPWHGYAGRIKTSPHHCAHLGHFRAYY
jgi:choline dehydrogenase-like flavoprotein